MRSLVIILFFSTFLSGCASYFLRKDCESKNWFQYGQEVALKGQRLEEDDYLNQCRKVEAHIDPSDLDLGFKKGRANYCTTEKIFEVGKSGDSFQKDMCEGENIRKLQEHHLAGIKEYCDEENGFNAGSSGKKYRNVCPKSLETKFLPNYRKGRRQYLTEVISTKSDQLIGIDREVSDLDRSRQNYMYQLALVRGRETVVSHTSYSNATHTRTDSVSVEESPEVTRRSMSIQNDINGIDNQINQKRSMQNKIREDILNLRVELATL
jgi:hypothetical protein